MSLATVLLGAALYAWWPAPAPPSGEADRVLIEKSKHTLTLLRDGQPIGIYRISIGRNPVGAKVRAGDHKTPEGAYVIDSRNPASGFHRALHISYPNTTDRERAAGVGVSPGGDIMIHGIKNRLGWLGRFQRWLDWTDGCVAVTDAEMDQLWKLIPDGIPVEIRP